MQQEALVGGFVEFSTFMYLSPYSSSHYALFISATQPVLRSMADGFALTTCFSYFVLLRYVEEVGTDWPLDARLDCFLSLSLWFDCWVVVCFRVVPFHSYVMMMTAGILLVAGSVAY
jgi:hypothetical protein